MFSLLTIKDTESDAELEIPMPHLVQYMYKYRALLTVNHLSQSHLVSFRVAMGWRSAPLCYNFGLVAIEIHYSHTKIKTTMPSKGALWPCRVVEFESSCHNLTILQWCSYLMNISHNCVDYRHGFWIGTMHLLSMDRADLKLHDMFKFHDAIIRQRQIPTSKCAF